MKSVEQEVQISSDVFGTKEEFIEKYGETTPDGVPRFGDDYDFLIHDDELDITDRVKSFVFGIFG